MQEVLQELLPLVIEATAQVVSYQVKIAIVVVQQVLLGYWNWLWFRSLIQKLVEVLTETELTSEQILVEHRDHVARLARYRHEHLRRVVYVL